MRAFIGLKLTDCQNEIVELQKRLKFQCPDANFTLSDNLHVTLVFLGEIDKKQVSSVKEVLQSLSFVPFDLIISKVKSLRDMIVLEAELTEELSTLQRKLATALKNRNFRFEDRKFYPHITLIRKAELNIFQKVNLKSRVTECILFSSERINNILTYTPIYITKAEVL